ncbi:MAG: replication protein [Acidobacteriia bacterium]|nr:replication protein [Terriglobia bacterium]
MLENEKTTERFDGFSAPCYTQVPNEFFDELMADLSMAEMRVVLYIARRTLGFGRRSDKISVNTLQHGITGSDGRKLDKGTGLSYESLRKALMSLKEKNIIDARMQRATDGGQLPTEYSLVFRRATNTHLPPSQVTRHPLPLKNRPPLPLKNRHL